MIRLEARGERLEGPLAHCEARGNCVRSPHIVAPFLSPLASRLSLGAKRC